jgi:hypothetical protein
VGAIVLAVVLAGLAVLLFALQWVFGQTLLNLPPAPADKLTTLGTWTLSDGTQRQAYEVQWWSRPSLFCVERVRGTNVDMLVPTKTAAVTNAVGVPSVWLIDLLPVGQVADYRLRTLTAAEWNTIPATNRAVCGAICVSN